MRHLRWFLLFLTLWMVITAPGSAALIVVPDEAPTIQIAITAAGDGDSILVRAGTYTENLTLTGKNVTVFGPSGAQATVISGGSTARILAISGPGVTTDTVFEDLTFRNGKAVEGGAIHLSATAGATLKNCRFISNIAERLSGQAAGGAIFVTESSVLVASDCFFQDNQAYQLNLAGDGIGGAIEAETGTRIDIRRSEFIHNTTSGFEGGLGGAIDVHGRAHIEECRFSEGSGWKGSGVYAGTLWVDRGGARASDKCNTVERPQPDNPPALGLIEAEVVIRGCVFHNNIAWTGAAIYGRNAMMTVEDNIFFENQSWFGLDAALVASYSEGTITNNTFAFNHSSAIGLELYNQYSLLVFNNIVSDNFNVGVLVWNAPPPGSIACNDTWMNGGGAYCGDTPDLTGTHGNIAADPLFCDAPTRDFRLDAASPCAPGNSPPQCGLIGALPVACGVTGVPPAAPAAQWRLTVVPNPVRGAARFELDSDIAPGALRIFDTQGRMVERLAPIGGHWQWTPDASMPAGIYFARPDAGPLGAAPVKFLYLR